VGRLAAHRRVLLRRCFESSDPAVLAPLLRDWEVASAEILESHLSSPSCASSARSTTTSRGLASLVAILDTCSLVIAGVERLDPFQARLTFAIGRHALVDLSQNFGLTPEPVEKTAAQSQGPGGRAIVAHPGWRPTGLRARAEAS